MGIYRGKTIRRIRRRAERIRQDRPKAMKKGKRKSPVPDVSGDNLPYWINEEQTQAFFNRKA